ncbi:hypothetical protein QBC32DRAFT_115133 [Pseudoneurospora amorphoporcata]|uniref:DUF7580 domain-containing protein n=1 Tax=Pseudoneurospora amorphoporcata TaxID=241081 RepID=A0AAN6NMQ6_9PEZI|nr:hypothetical protein QBC32DRAFT_115133 [Pseudoneurospora amorphoporcata]
MSGIEVVGLVLGVLPIVIQALQGYKSIMSSLRNVESDIQALILGLETERVRLRTSCELLLEGIVPADDIDRLLEDPFSEKWKALGVANKLKIRLYDAITTYQKTIDDMKTVEAELKRRLGFMLQEDGELRFRDKKSLVKEWKSKSEFSLNKKDYDHIILRLQSANTFLDSCAKRGRQLETSRKQRSYNRVVNTLRNLARSLFKALQNAAASCYCPKPHDACLELVARDLVFIHNIDTEDQMAKTVDFHVALSSAGTDRTLAEQSLQSQPRWTSFRLQCTGFGPARLQSTRSSLSSTCPSASPPCPETATLQPSKEYLVEGSTRVRGWSRTAAELTSLLTKPLKSRKRVSFAQSSSTAVGALIQTSTTSTLVSLPLSGSSSPSPSLHYESPLSLCLVTINKGKTRSFGQDSCYGCIVDKVDDRTFGLYPPQRKDQTAVDSSQPGPSEFMTSLTLRQILDGQLRTSTNTCRVPKLNLETKLSMAYSISASVVHIHTTPWSSKVLTLDDIVMLVDAKNNFGERPFILRSIMSEAQSNSPHNTSLTLEPETQHIFTEVQPDNRPFDPMPFSLGLLLLQLILGRVVDEIDLPRLRDSGVEGVYPLTIERAEQVGEHASRIASVKLNSLGGDILLNAVKWCLDSHGDIRGFDDQDFCQEFCVNVVEMLEATAKGVAKARSRSSQC